MDSELWHACAGPLVQLPPVNSVVYYFPQGHAETAYSPPNFPGTTPPMFRCRLTALELAADPKTDEVYANMTLAPTAYGSEISGGDDVAEPPCVSKVLTQSDANNGGGFSVPKACADRIFPALDYDSDPPVQTIVPRDVHGTEWKFRHIFRGTPRRHLLTSGWSTFVNSKSFIAGDCILFTKLAGDGMGVGVRRGRRSGESARKVKAEDVLEAARLAAEGKPFDVIFEPRVGTEFVVRAEAVDRMIYCRSAFAVGAEVKMDFEDSLDPTQKKPFLGTLSSIQPLDPIFFPFSFWRSLQVVWDKQQTGDNDNQIQNENDVSQVNPWSISFQSTMIPMPVFQPQALSLLTNHSSRAGRDDTNELVPRWPSEENESGPTTSPSDTTTDNISQTKVVREVWLFGVDIASPPVTSPSDLSGASTEPELTSAQPSNGGEDKSDIPSSSCVIPKKKRKRMTLRRNRIDSSFNDINARNMIS